MKPITFLHPVVTGWLTACVLLFSVQSSFAQSPAPGPAEGSGKVLKEVTISSTKRLLTVSNNKVSYDLSKDSLNNKSNTANALRQLPGVDV